MAQSTKPSTSQIIAPGELSPYHMAALSGNIQIAIDAFDAGVPYPKRESDDPTLTPLECALVKPINYKLITLFYQHNVIPEISQFIDNYSNMRDMLNAKHMIQNAVVMYLSMLGISSSDGSSLDTATLIGDDTCGQLIDNDDEYLVSHYDYIGTEIAPSIYDDNNDETYIDPYELYYSCNNIPLHYDYRSPPSTPIPADEQLGTGLDMALGFDLRKLLMSTSYHNMSTNNTNSSRDESDLLPYHDQTQQYNAPNTLNSNNTSQISSYNSSISNSSSDDSSINTLPVLDTPLGLPQHVIDKLCKMPIITWNSGFTDDYDEREIDAMLLQGALLMDPADEYRNSLQYTCHHIGKTLTWASLALMAKLCAHCISLTSVTDNNNDDDNDSEYDDDNQDDDTNNNALEITSSSLLETMKSMYNIAVHNHPGFDWDDVFDSTIFEQVQHVIMAIQYSKKNKNNNNNNNQSGLSTGHDYTIDTNNIIEQHPMYVSSTSSSSSSSVSAYTSATPSIHSIDDHCSVEIHDVRLDLDTDIDCHFNSTNTRMLSSNHQSPALLPSAAPLHKQFH